MFREFFRRGNMLVVATAVLLATTPYTAHAACVGDCNHDGEVTVDELIDMVNVALGSAQASCSAGDANADGEITIDEILTAVNATLNGCPATATPTPSGTATASMTATPSSTATASFTATATPTATGGLASTPTPTPNPTGQVHPVLQNLSGALLSITGTSAADVYTVGADANDGTGPMVLHFNGQTWQRLNTGATSGLWWISVTPIDGDFYMAGDQGLILRYTPSTGMFQKPVTPGKSQTLFGIWGSDASHIWAVGGDLSNQDSGGVLWRFDGKTWNADSTLANLRPAGIPILYKVWGRSENDVYVCGRLGLIFHFDGVQWTQLNVDLGGVDPLDLPLFTIHGNATEVAATGGLINGVVYELLGSTFENRAAPGIPQLNGVFLGPDGTGVAVGVAGTVASRDATGWRQERGINTVLDLHGTWIDPDGGVWAVGGDLTTTLTQGMVVYGGTAAVGSTILQAQQVF